MQKDLVTVIIPVYNSEKHIENCIKSVINQTYKDLEILLINDGSKDNTKSICEYYEKQDNRIKLINQENKGVSSARNIGLEKAKGEYIAFIDSDDTIQENTYEIMIEEMKKENAQIGIFNFKRIDIKSNHSDNYGIKERKIYKFPQILEDYFPDNEYNKIGEANWNKIFKKDVIGDTKFEKIKIGEDFIFNYEVLKKAEKIINIPEVFYNYNENNDSATLSGFDKRKLLQYIGSREKILNDIKDNYEQYYEKAFRALCDTYYYSIEKFIYEKDLNKEKDFLELIDKYNKFVTNKDYKQLYEDSSRDKQIKEIIANYKKIIKKNNIKRIIKNPLKKVVPNKVMIYIKNKRKQKRVAILTINDDHNLGNRLQNYATQEILKKKGVKVNTIYNSTNIPNSTIIKVKIKNFIKIILVSAIRKYKRSINFAKFDNKISYSKITINKDNIPEKINKIYDTFFTGSDQVWNPMWDRISKIDFLSFAPKDKRNSMAASFGVSQIPEEKKEMYKNYLSQLNHISVREERGKEIVKELTGREDSVVLVDPTMLLSRDDWDKVAKKPEGLKDEKYILNYFLGKLSEKRRKEIERIAKENNCKIINILDENDPFYIAGPSEFVYLEKNAFLVCTDSFHSSIFAILYNIPFIVFEREDKQEKMNSRLETLLNKFGLQDVKFNDTINKNQLECDYTNAYKILKDEREKADKFLNSIL